MTALSEHGPTANLTRHTMNEKSATDVS